MAFPATISPALSRPITREGFAYISLFRSFSLASRACAVGEVLKSALSDLVSEGLLHSLLPFLVSVKEQQSSAAAGHQQQQQFGGSSVAGTIVPSIFSGK